jgi:hypothetical protein
LNKEFTTFILPNVEEEKNVPELFPLLKKEASSNKQGKIGEDGHMGMIKVLYTFIHTCMKIE